MHRRPVGEEGCVILHLSARFVASLSRLVPPSYPEVGQAQAAPLLGCPTVPSTAAHRTCERSGQHRALVARTRVFAFLSLREKEVKRVGQWVKALNCAALTCPTLQLNSGTGKTAPEAPGAGAVYSPTFARHSLGVVGIFAVGIKSGLLPVNSTCKKYTSSIGATA